MAEAREWLRESARDFLLGQEQHWGGVPMVVQEKLRRMKGDFAAQLSAWMQERQRVEQAAERVREEQEARLREKEDIGDEGGDGADDGEGPTGGGVYGMPQGQAEARGLMPVVAAEYVGEGRGTIVLTPDARYRRDALAAQQPVIIEANLPEDLKEAKAQEKKLYGELERTYTNRVTGRVIEMVNSGFDKLRDHSANLRTLKIIPALGELVENAIPLFENTGKGKHWYHYGVAVVINGEPFFVRLVAYEGNNRKLQLDIFHDAQVSPREVVEGTSSLGRSRRRGEQGSQAGERAERAGEVWQGD